MCVRAFHSRLRKFIQSKSGKRIVKESGREKEERRKKGERRRKEKGERRKKKKRRGHFRLGVAHMTQMHHGRVRSRLSRSQGSEDGGVDASSRGVVDDLAWGEVWV